MVRWTAALHLAATLAGVDAGLAGLRGNASGGELEEVVGTSEANATSLWGLPTWGSCARYGCSNRYVWGQLCGCWPRCHNYGVCCGDYDRTCSAPVPAPAPRPSQGSCAAYGCPQYYAWRNKCQCNDRCHDFGNCCSDVGTCHGGSRPAPAPPTPAPVPEPAPTPAPPPAPAPPPEGQPSDAEVFTFHVYRAQSDASYPPKNTNAANLVGVMWYLQNEVVITDPPKFGIKRILRYEIKTKAPQRLLDVGMNFGVRYAYDSQKCTGPGDCSTMYDRYGYFVGCNKFESMYPFPIEKTDFAGGVWYSLPGDGACDGPPTGADDCTYSWSWPPEEISLKDLVGENSTEFWAGSDNETANAAKVKAAADLFSLTYPDTKDETAPDCDFDFARFWG